MLENHVHGRTAFRWISGRFISGKRNEKINGRIVFKGGLLL
jgi:hypothetical protein